MRTLYHLFIEAQKGDHEAAAEILKRFEPKVSKSSRFVNWNDQEDLKQELAIEIIKAIHRFEPKGIPGFWEFIDSKQSKKE